MTEGAGRNDPSHGTFRKLRHFQKPACTQGKVIPQGYPRDTPAVLPDGTPRGYKATRMAPQATPRDTPHDVADTRPKSSRNPVFRGRCYLCGAPCRRWFCYAHKWAGQ
jgi:hypothetical protein